MLDAIFEALFRRLRRLLQAFAGTIKFPPVIRTANPLFIDAPIGERCKPMWAVFTDQPIASGFIAINDQVFAEYFDRSDRFLLSQLSCRRNRMPVASQQLAA